MAVPAYLALAAMLAATDAIAPGLPPARPAVPFEKHAEIDCDWVMKSPAEEWIRGSIGQGDDDPILYLVDPAFNGWSDTEDLRVALSAGASAELTDARAYAVTAGEGPSSLGIYLDEDARRLVGGAKEVTVWKDGMPVLNLAFANTPTSEELDACVRPPGWDDDGDSE